jgi:glycerophosphoryl diester phosphodiesterase
MRFVKILLLLMLTGLAQAAEAPAKLVIAHRGASGYLPEQPTTSWWYSMT